MIEKARAVGKVMADVLLPGDTQARHSGELAFVDNAVDRWTGTSLHGRPSVTPTGACFPASTFAFGWPSGSSRMR